jgi:hypothetical protein
VDWQSIATLGAAALSAFAVAYTARSSRRAQEIEKAAEQTAYERAEKINKGIVADLETALERVRRNAATANERADRLERQVATLRRLLIKHAPGVNITDFTD